MILWGCLWLLIFSATPLKLICFLLSQLITQTGTQPVFSSLFSHSIPCGFSSPKVFLSLSCQNLVITFQNSRFIIFNIQSIPSLILGIIWFLWIPVTISYGHILFQVLLYKSYAKNYFINSSIQEYYFIFSSTLIWGCQIKYRMLVQISNEMF